MTRAGLLFVTVYSLAIAAACSSGNDADPGRLLRLGPDEITEAKFRDILREDMPENESYEIQCAALDKLSDEEATAAVIEFNLRASLESADNDDQRRLVQIYREECETAGLS